MPGRFRSAVFETPKGNARNYAGTIFLGGGTVNNGVSSISDVTGAGDCAQLTINKWSFSGCLLQKPFDGNNATNSQFVNYVPDAFYTDANWPAIAVSGMLDQTTIATRAVARTNPSRPYVDVPVNIIELADVVRMIRDRGRGILFQANDRTRGLPRHARNVARTNLAYQFGIRPLVGDLIKLTNFTQAVNDRIGEVNRLTGAKGLRRTVHMDSGSAVSSRLIVMQSALATTDQPRATWTGVTTVDVRAHVRWIPSEDVSHLAPGEMLDRIKRAVLGYTNTGVGIDLSTLWEVLPWSWMIDWGSNIGSYLAAKRNTIPASLLGCWISEETNTIWTTPPLTFAFGAGHMESGTFQRVGKKRSPSVGIAPTAHFPFLNGNQVGILASLSVTRRR